MPIPDPTQAPRAMPTPFAGAADRAADASAETQATFERLGRIGEEEGKKLGEIYDREKHKADVLAVNNALTSLQQAGNNALYGKLNDDGSRVPGYLDTHGLDAQKNGADAFQSLQDRVAGTTEGMQTPEQKDMLKQQASQLLERWDSTIHQHSFQQTQVAQVDSVNASKAEALRTAALTPGDDDVARKAIARVVAAQDALVTSPADALARADQVHADVTAARLDVLLKDPSGFPEAERIFTANKGVLGTKADDYEGRIEKMKLNAAAVVTANQIIGAVSPDDVGKRYFQGPDEAKFETHLAELAEKDPVLYAKVEPIAHARLAIQKAGNETAKKQFINDAVGQFNMDRSHFFATDTADRLNKVDSDKYKALVEDNFRWARANGDDSARARREQADRDAIALMRYKNFSDDPGVRSGMSIDSFVAGEGVSPRGLEHIKELQTEDVARVKKGMGSSEQQFVGDVKAKLQLFAPEPGNSPQSRAAAKQWWSERTAAAVDAYAAWTFNNPNKKPDAKAVLELRSQIIAQQPPNPKNPKSIDAAAEAIKVNAGAGGPVPTGRKKIYNGVTYYELSDGSAVTK